MSTANVLDQMLGAAKQMVSGDSAFGRAADYATEKMDMGDAAPSNRMVGGALAAGAVALLLGTSGGRRLGGAALKMGALAGLGTLAWKAWQTYSGEDDPQEAGTRIDRLEGQAAETRARILMAAMIAAAKCDGHIDDEEREAIELRMRGMDGLDFSYVEAALKAPSDPAAIARLADTPQAAREIYAVSLLMCDTDAPDQRRYLDDLAGALSLDPGVMRAIEEEARAA